MRRTLYEIMSPNDVFSILAHEEYQQHRNDLVAVNDDYMMDSSCDFHDAYHPRY